MPKTHIQIICEEEDKALAIKRAKDEGFEGKLSPFIRTLIRKGKLNK